MPPVSLRLRSSARPLLALLLVALAAGPAGAATYAGEAVVGPTSALQKLDGLELAPDGSGAILYTLQDGGVDHVFASRLVNGAWSGPERVDGGFAGPSSQATLAVADGGRLVVAFVNGGNVYAVTRPEAGSPYGAPQTVWGGGGASDPAVDLSVNGKGYLAFAAPGGGGHDVRVAYARDAGPWSLAAPPLDANPALDAGAGAGRPRVGVAADGIAIVVWGESGRVIARRVQGTRPSIVYAAASDGVALEGIPIVSADTPTVAVEDDDSFAGVAFRGSFTVGGAPRSRAIYRRLRGSQFEPATPIDQLPFTSGQSSLAPSVATVGTGQGIALGSGDATFFSYAMLLRGDAAPAPLVTVDSLAQSAAPTYAVPAVATTLKMLVAWQLTPAGGPPRVDARYYDGTAFAAEQVLSRPDLGPTDASAGLAASGDGDGDLAVAYVQRVPGQGPAIAIAVVDQPPGRFAAKRVSGFQRTDRPSLSWTPSREDWGRYFRVTVDGAQAGVTGRRSFRPASPLTQGVHTWQVTALDRRGQQYIAPAATIRLDSVVPVVGSTLSGARRAGAALRLTVAASDAPPPVATGATPIQTSGVAQVFVDWGDGTRLQIARRSRHRYAKPGRYALRIVVIDRAGNRATQRQVLRIARPPKRKHKPKHR